MDKIIVEVIATVREYWRQPWMRWLAPGAIGLLVLGERSDYYTNSPSWSALVLAGALAVAVRVLWQLSNRIPRCPKGRVGIVIALRTRDPKQADQLTDDFVNQLRRLF